MGNYLVIFVSIVTGFILTMFHREGDELLMGVGIFMCLIAIIISIIGIIREEDMFEF